MSKVYKTVVVFADRLVPSKLRPLWEHEAGPKTIFFWAPAFKWALVAVSVDEYRRPLDSVSPTQSATLAATGLIWTRYCLAQRPYSSGLQCLNGA
ncbi:mitochondrial pyruvate carrier 2-like isoform X2 [Pieris brassicae]|uniref:mitochondrial pyruvate carrier 2-like isoform X2 n=1 Tax=Pieris brassicae TaxID=7116 RepID=UPI001E6609B2|nr:mitochondrial pyruvate carrier 2-like isoform X2 [Pieris brassicae]